MQRPWNLTAPQEKSQKTGLMRVFYVVGVFDCHKSSEAAFYLFVALILCAVPVVDLTASLSIARVVLARW